MVSKVPAFNDNNYAEAGIVEYWILNISEQTLEIHRDPVDGTYRTVKKPRLGETVSPGKFPDSTLAVDDIVR